MSGQRLQEDCRKKLVWGRRIWRGADETGAAWGGSPAGRRGGPGGGDRQPRAGLQSESKRKDAQRCEGIQAARACKRRDLVVIRPSTRNIIFSLVGGGGEAVLWCILRVYQCAAVSDIGPVHLQRLRWRRPQTLRAMEIPVRSHRVELSSPSSMPAKVASPHPHSPTAKLTPSNPLKAAPPPPPPPQPRPPPQPSPRRGAPRQPASSSSAPHRPPHSSASPWPTGP